MEQCCGRGAAATPTNADLHSGRYNVARAATWKLFKRLGLTWLCCGICVGSYAAALAIARTKYASGIFFSLSTGAGTKSSAKRNAA